MAFSARPAAHLDVKNEGAEGRMGGGECQGWAVDVGLVGAVSSMCVAPSPNARFLAAPFVLLAAQVEHWAKLDNFHDGS